MEVNKVVIVGWRATESHFLELLQLKLGARSRLLIVAKDGTEAKSIGQQLVSAGIGNDFREAPHGFSRDIVADSQIESFLWMPL